MSHVLTEGVRLGLFRNQICLQIYPLLLLLGLLYTLNSHDAMFEFVQDPNENTVPAQLHQSY